MDIISIVLAVVGVLGAGGALALFLLAPVLLAVIVTRAESALGAMLSTRLGCALLAGLACFILADQVRSLRDGARCERAIAELIAQAKAAGDKRDADITQAVEAQYTPILADLRKESDELQQQVREYEEAKSKSAAAGKRMQKDVRERPGVLHEDGRERPGACLLRPDALQLRQRVKKPGPAARR
jgi:hypothetical protein